MLADGAYPQNMTTTTTHAATDQAGSTLKQRFEGVKRRIEESARRVNRPSENIVLVAVTKFASFDQIRELIELGHIDLGENRVQQLVQRVAQVDEFLQRANQLGPSSRSSVPDSVRWHMIGNLQRNKVRKVLPLVRLIHSIDSLRLAEEIQSANAKKEESIEVLIQVNTTGDRNKGGIAPAAILHLIEQVDTMINIKVRGLMNMAPLVEDPEDSRPNFERCRELFEDIKLSSIVDDRFNILSMGMSNDFEVAIECGANLVRVGTAIFGQPKPESDSTEA